MTIQKLQFNPGIDREGTAYDSEGGWFDCNLVRFRAGRPEKFGGWEKITPSTYLGTVRALHNWIANDGTKYLGLGSNLKYYLYEGNIFNDITPIRNTTAAGDVTFAKVADGDATLTVTDTDHGCTLNDFVTFSGAVSLGGGGNISAVVLNQEYQISKIIDANTYHIEAKDTSGNPVLANSSDTGNGGSNTVGAYQINVGLDDFVAGVGYGASTWGGGGWGGSSSLSAVNQLRIWTHDNFGQDLIINPRGGQIYRWQPPTTTTRATLLSAIGGANKVPTKALQVMTSETDRHLIVLGADPLSGGNRTGVVDPMLVAFSDQENNLEFEPLTTNTAGSVRLSSGSQIIGGVKARQEVVIFTDTSVYSMQFIGPPFTFSINLIDNSTGLIGPKAAITAPGGVFFMSYDSFYVYSGSVQKLSCAVKNYVFSDFNQSQAFKVFGFSNKEHNEVGWFYPSKDSQEIDRYVIYNYVDNIWYYGQLVRTAWLDSGVESFPQAVGAPNLFQHEIGFNDDGAAMQNVFIESSDLDLGDGESFAFLSRIIPDIKFLGSGNVKLITKQRDFPGVDPATETSNSTISPNTKQVFIRSRGRQFILRIQSTDQLDDIGTGWRLGATRLDLRTDGRR
tara:strand:+ start:1540 stop:3399 length:1860 start_codon:yes stop_codon:yes gene_type:complete